MRGLWTVLGALAGWLGVSVVGGVLIGAMTYRAGADAAEMPLVVVAVIAGIILGGWGGARAYDRREGKKLAHTADSTQNRSVPPLSPGTGTPSPSTAASQNSNLVDEVRQIQRLVELHNEGVLSAEEFSAAKKRILERDE